MKVGAKTASLTQWCRKHPWQSVHQRRIGSSTWNASNSSNNSSGQEHLLLQATPHANCRWWRSKLPFLVNFERIHGSTTKTGLTPTKPVAASHPMKLVAVNVRSPLKKKRLVHLLIKFVEKNLSVLLLNSYPLQQLSGFPTKITWTPSAISNEPAILFATTAQRFPKPNHMTSTFPVTSGSLPRHFRFHPQTPPIQMTFDLFSHWSILMTVITW